MSETNNATKLKKVLGSRIRELTMSDENISSLGIKQDTLNKYYKGQRFPTTENLVAIKKHYNVSFAYLFGDIDNKDPNLSEIGCKLGLSQKAAKKLLSINKNKNLENKKIQLFALNQLLENIDFLELGNLLIIPNEENPNIKSEDIYAYYSIFLDYGHYEDYYFSNLSIQRKKEYDEFILNKRTFDLFKKIRNSKACANIFIEYVDNKEKNYVDYGSISEFINKENNFQEPDEEFYEILEKDRKETEKKNKKIVEDRKNKIGI